MHPTRPAASVFSAALLSTGLLLLAAACGGPADEMEQSSATQYRIGLALCMSCDTPFFVSLIDGAAEAADRLGVELVTVCAEEDDSLQVLQLRRMADQDIDLLLLNPVNFSVCPAVEDLAAGGIPVFTIDRGIRSDRIICHIASDNRSGGQMAGDYLAEALHRRGEVVEIRGTDGSSAAQERGAGFRDAISSHPDLRVVECIHGQFSRQVARERFAEVLASHESIQGVFAHNDDMALGALEAAHQAGKTNLMVVGFDAIEEAILAVDRGEMLATVAQRPAEMGRIGVETAVDYLQGNDVPDSIEVDLALIIR